MNQIDDNRWKEANEAEKKSWEETLANESFLRGVDIFESRHSHVMFMNQQRVSNLRILDIGGGPISGLLLHPEIKEGVVIDPIEFSPEIVEKYKQHNISYIQTKAEDYLENYAGKKFDEVWMYNCLQHVQDPEKILRNMYKSSFVLRISEPCNTPISIHHPFTFTPDWYKTILSEISVFGFWKVVDFDYPYVGGIYCLNDLEEGE